MSIHRSIQQARRARAIVGCGSGDDIDQRCCRGFLRILRLMVPVMLQAHAHGQGFTAKNRVRVLDCRLRYLRCESAAGRAWKGPGSSIDDC